MILLNAFAIIVLLWLVPRCPFDAAALALIGDFLNFVVPNQKLRNMNNLSKISEELSNTQCPECGRYHKVELRYMETAPHLRPILFYNFPEGACDSFKDFVKTFLSTR